MRRICMWCGRVIEDDEGPTSHVVCPPDDRSEECKRREDEMHERLRRGDPFAVTETINMVMAP
jgi:hypothetical protein